MGNKFTPEVESRLQYYVYALVDPRTDQIFYVGKGVGNRVFQHIAEADGKPFEVKHFIIWTL